ncbi:putative tRNA-binding protein [Spiroplasma clarkii]|uniref:tRNA-binding protein n=1 Tax=Spiroplasma clarkii TaxID=2139 RepID=A0A1Y0KZH5_9MOLU|nr:hypothetical protein [Spiroplasma clarkii]ARU91162.1 putative tRNA-binding protein [Spiroplasma clarkii]ATX70601.1 tRNA-binding protein [Spiroplasma clarkii]
MKFFTRYVPNFYTLVVTFKNLPVTSTKSVPNCELLYNEAELIGANLLQPKIDKHKTYYLEDAQLQAYASKELKKYIKIEGCEPQFLVVEVKQCEPIEGTHLSLCQVSDGVNTWQVVCGASNVKTGLLTCLATVGAFMPNGLQISKGSLKGHDSFGMLCSAKELQVFAAKWDKPGIIEVSQKKYMGKPIWEVFANEI